MCYRLVEIRGVTSFLAEGGAKNFQVKIFPKKKSKWEYITKRDVKSGKIQGKWLASGVSEKFLRKIASKELKNDKFFKKIWYSRAGAPPPLLLRPCKYILFYWMRDTAEYLVIVTASCQTVTTALHIFLNKLIRCRTSVFMLLPLFNQCNPYQVRLGTKISSGRVSKLYYLVKI